MTNTELIKAARICANQTCCDNCPRYDNGLDPEECTKKLMLDCAEAIEKITLDYEDALFSSLVETMMVLDSGNE